MKKEKQISYMGNKRLSFEDEFVANIHPLNTTEEYYFEVTIKPIKKSNEDEHDFTE